MARRTGGERIHGPYPHGNRWRIILVDGDGGRAAESFETEGAALAAITKLRERAAGLKVRTAIAEYQTYQLDELQLKPSSIAVTGWRLRSLLQVDDHRDGGLVAELTPRRARILVAAHRHRLVRPKRPRGEPREMVTRERSVAYRRGALEEARTWAAWCVARGDMPADPFDGIEILGARRRGKLQLRATEAIKFEAKALELYDAGERDALAAALVLDLGCRATEIAESEVRDYDLGCTVFWVTEENTKTENGRRQLAIPEHLQPRVLDATRGRGGSTAMFPSLHRHKLLLLVKRICRLAGVPEVCTQALRGVFASLATLDGIASEAVARQLGHGDRGTTAERNYIAPGASRQGQQATALRVLAGGRR